LPLVGGENFFDGFGFQLPAYQRRYGWKGTSQVSIGRAAM